MAVATLLATTATAIMGAVSASAQAPQETVLVVGSEAQPTEGLDVTAALRSLGYKVRLTLLPATPAASGHEIPAPKKYAAVWSVAGDRVYTPEDRIWIERYVSRGGGLYLGGVQHPLPPEGEPPTTPENLDQQLARAVLTNKQINVTRSSATTRVGFSSIAIDGISQEPNELGEITQHNAGGLSGISPRNIFSHIGRVPTSAAFDEQDMASNAGRLVIYTANWDQGGVPGAERDAIIENIETFLEARAGRVRPQASEYVAMGDGWTAGSGSLEYLAGTDVKHGCYVASNGYPHQLAEAAHRSLAEPACGPATVKDVWEGSKREFAQIPTVGPNTSAVSISLGYNDIGFPAILKACHSKGESPAPNCAGEYGQSVNQALSWLETGRGPGRYKITGGKEQRVRNYQPSLQQLFESLSYQAFGGEIDIVGYPEPFATATVGRANCTVGTIGRAEASYYWANLGWLDEQIDRLDATIEGAATRAQETTGTSIRFIDPRPTFTGHGLCDTESPWLNPLEPKQSPAVASFLTNASGEADLRELVEGSTPALRSTE
jgi:hypothetical protein